MNASVVSTLVSAIYTIERVLKMSIRTVIGRAPLACVSVYNRGDREYQQRCRSCHNFVTWPLLPINFLMLLQGSEGEASTPVLPANGSKIRNVGGLMPEGSSSVPEGRS